MRARINEKNNSAWVTAAWCLALAMLGLLHFGGAGTKWLTLLAGFGVIALLVLGDRRRLWNAPSLLLLGYAAFSWVTVFWAMSGKFHLREGSKLLIAVFFFLLVAMHKKFDGAFVRRVMGVIAGISAIYAFLSVEAVSTGLCKTLLGLFAVDVSQIVFNSSRLFGIFGNSNIEASIYAAGIFCALALVCGAEKKWQRLLWMFLLPFSAFAFLLVFSMGAIVCFAAAVAVYLIFADTGRGAALLRMLGAAVPAFVCGILASRMYAGGHARTMLLLMLAAAGMSALLELLLAERLSAGLERHQRGVFGVLIAVVLGAAVYVAAALNVTDAYVFGSAIERGLSLPAGEHVVQLDADEGVYVRIYTRSREQVMLSSNTQLYLGAAEPELTITVPEDAELCNFYFWTEREGAELRRTVVDGAAELPLRYRLLPDFVANRIQNLTMNTSILQRQVYREDALKLWRLSPVVGSGVGAFETGVTSVQDFPYETKYVHQHYLQILLEDGVIGLALYVGALVTMLLALWKKRKQMRESEFCWFYPALCAEFVMNGAQMCWDVSMSMLVFLCMTYALYGLLVGMCAEPLAERAAAEEAGKKKKTQAKRLDPSLLARNLGIGFTAVVVLTLCANLYASSKISAPVGSNEEFMSNLSTAARLDLYEYNDKKLSYVIASLNEGGEAYRAQADEYAAQLAKAQSNTIPRYLVGYYLQTQQYDKAIDEAIFGASYSASNSDTWNSCAALLNEVLFQSMLTPLLTGEREALMAKLTDYYNALQAYNASALVPVELSEEAQAFFDKIVVLNGCMDDDRRFAETLFTT